MEKKDREVLVEEADVVDAGYERDEDGDALVLPPEVAAAKPVGVVAGGYQVDPEHHVVIWELTPREERLALKRSKGADLDVGYQLLRHAIRAINGKLVDWKEGQADRDLDRLFQEVGSKGRSLLFEAYRRQCTPSEEESEAFFASAKVGV